MTEIPVDQSSVSFVCKQCIAWGKEKQSVTFFTANDGEAHVMEFHRGRFLKGTNALYNRLVRQGEINLFFTRHRILDWMLSKRDHEGNLGELDI